MHFPDPDYMQRALENEGIQVKDDQIQCFQQLFWDPSAELRIP
jgi:methylated-DNA-protein-cysteine methyltransferase-like protein